MATVIEALTAARAHLRDFEATLWTDPKLMPLMQEAHRELQLKLRVNGVPVLSAVTTALSVPALTTDLTTVTGYPTTLVEPIWLKVRNVGGTNADYKDVDERKFVPNSTQDSEIWYWAWIGERVLINGSTQAKEIQLRYRRRLTLPTQVSEEIGIIGGELYLSYRMAGLALGGNGGAEFNGQAIKLLDQIVVAAAKEEQNLPVRRQGYHRGTNRKSWWI